MTDWSDGEPLFPFWKPRLQNRLKPLAANDIEQSEGWAFGLLGSALQLRNVAGGEIEIAGEGSLAEVGALSHFANLFAFDWFGRGQRLRPEQAESDLFVFVLVHQATVKLVAGHLQKRLG